jgi:hypothetical protein
VNQMLLRGSGCSAVLCVARVLFLQCPLLWCRCVWDRLKFFFTFSLRAVQCPGVICFLLGDGAILPWPPCIGVMGNSLCSSGILTPNPNDHSLYPLSFFSSTKISEYLCVFLSSCFFFSDLSPFLSSFLYLVCERLQLARELH